MKYYLQDSRAFVGNNILWWKEGGGYVDDLEQAEVFTKEEAFKQQASRVTDIPWPKKYVDEHITHVVDMQDVNYAFAMKEVN